jgi:hypothetical protein
MRFFETLSYSGDISPSSFGRTIREKLAFTKVIHINHVDPKKNLLQFYDRVTEEIGHCCLLGEDAETNLRTGEKWFEVRYDPKVPKSYRHAKVAQPLHTDGSYIKNTPNLTFIFCINQVPEGGETIFLDSHDLITLLEENEPSLLNLLSTTFIKFSKVGDEKTAPVILRENNNEPLLNWNYFCLDPSASPEIKKLSIRFSAFLEQVALKSDKILEVHLQPGDAVVFRDQLLFHGRNSFDAEKPNERYFQKACIKL